LTAGAEQGVGTGGRGAYALGGLPPDDDGYDDGCDGEGSDDGAVGGGDGGDGLAPGDIPDAEPEEDAELEQLDEAGSAMNDYKRGKRLKRLVKVLMGPVAQAPNARLRFITLAVVAVLIAVDIAMFAAFMAMTTQQKAQARADGVEWCGAGRAGGLEQACLGCETGR
jgi:hypothetical protein